MTNRNWVTGQKVKIDSKGQNIKIGNLSIGTSLPDNFPKDIPIYPKAEVASYLGGAGGKLTGATITLTSTGKAAEIYQYYNDQLKAKGWEVEGSEIGDMRMITITKDNRKAVFTINPNKTKTDIAIGIASE